MLIKEWWASQRQRLCQSMWSVFIAYDSWFVKYPKHQRTHSAYLGSTTSPVTESRVPPRGSFGPSPSKPRGGTAATGGPPLMGARGSGMGTVGGQNRQQEQR